MKVILTMAITANGIIATKAGSEDFFSDEVWSWFVKQTKGTGCYICGRKTYEAMVGWEGEYLNDLDGIKKLVISGSNPVLREGFELTNSPKEALSKLEAEGFKEVTISGASVNSSFVKASLVDEVIFAVSPVVLGEGIPVFSPDEFQLSMELMGVEKIDGGIVQLHYKVLK
ncbi:MAG: Bifunctional deaminase-reductase protein [uncultured bacterium]|nr:MAG: Bifunctional deaminase-reductase protein [uncultured bacterium]